MPSVGWIETLKAVLNAAPRRSPLILTNTKGVPRSAAGFSASWRKLWARAGIEGLTFNDLRGTAVTRLALAGCDHAEIRAVTGHTLPGVQDILDRHYLSREELLRRTEAIAKLETGTDFSKHSPKWPNGSAGEAEKA
jgi:integrase